MSETGIETQAVDPWAVISVVAALLTLMALCGGAVPVPLTGFVCFPAAAGLGLVAFATGLASLHRIRSSGEGGRTFALIGTGIGGFVLVAAICLLALGIWVYPSLVDLIHRFRL